MRRRSRKRKRFSNILACLMLMFMLLSILPLEEQISVHADTYTDTYVSDRTGSIRAVLMSQPDNGGKGTLYSDVSMKLYQAGTVSEKDGKLNITLDSGFESSGIRTEMLTTADKWATAARVFAGMIDTSGIAFKEETSDSQGEIIYNNLPQGLYLLVQSSARERLDISPSLITVPMQENGQWNYDVKVYPKFTPENAKADISVTKRLFFTSGSSQTTSISAENAVFKIGIYADKAGTVPFRDDYIKEIRIKGTSTGTAVWKDIPAGTYYVYELDEKNVPVPVNEKNYIDEENFWMYNIKKENEKEDNQIVVSASGSSGKMYVDNYFYYLPHGYHRNTIDTQRTSLNSREVSSTLVKKVRTGDHTQIFAWTAIFVIALTGIAIVYNVKRKKR